MVALSLCLSSAALAQDAAPAIDGWCPVAYVASHRAIHGVPEWNATHFGRTWHFVNQAARDMFVAHPDRYHVQFDGWCAEALASGQLVAADPRLFSVHGGRIYLFASDAAKRAFEADADSKAAAAAEAYARLRSTRPYTASTRHAR